MSTSELAGMTVEGVENRLDYHVQSHIQPICKDNVGSDGISIIQLAQLILPFLVWCSDAPSSSSFKSVLGNAGVSKQVSVHERSTCS